MKFGRILLLLLALNQLFAQEIFTFRQNEPALPADGQPVSTVVPLERWQLHLAGQSRSITVPFVVSSAKAISVQTKFVLPHPTPSQSPFLVSQGIKGTAEIYLNGHLISFIPNAQQPFKISLPKEFLTDDSLQTLRLQIKQPQNTNEGFPLIVYTYSESRVIGIPAPISVIWESRPVITKFRQQLVQNGNTTELHYTYTVNIDGPYKRLQLDEWFRRNSDGKTLFRKMRYSKDLNGKTLTVQGVFPLDSQSLWFVDAPQKITLKLRVHLFGPQKRLVEQTFHFGARSFNWRKGAFFLNGRKISIHGITWHQNLRRFKGLRYDSLLTKDLSRIKALGVNAVRLSHFLPTPAFLNLCDSLGLLVFAELPLWRYPKSFFEENYLLEMSKNVCLQMAPFYLEHPSLVALGLGQELPVEHPVTQKFMFILNGKIKSLLPVVTYVSPIPGHLLPPEKISDFYLFDLYRPLNVLSDTDVLNSTSLIGKIGVLPDKLFRKERSAQGNVMDRGLFLKEEIAKALFYFKTAGGFIESYEDWYVPYPSLVIQKDHSSFIMPQGLYDITGEPKQWTKLLQTPWQVDRSAVSPNKITKEKPTNFYSILITMVVLLFFSLYRRLPRLRENLRRSLRHSYGFFVDMRERRIIPLLNSITVGVFFSLIIASFIAAQIYYYHDSYWLQEIMAVFFVPLGLFSQYLKISQSSWLLTATLFLFFFLLPLIGAICVKLYSVFSRTRVRFRQGIAVMFWAGAPLLWFFPISLISYHWVFYHQSAEIFWIVLGLFFVWTHFRLVKGLHILFYAGSTTVFMVLLLCYAVPFLIFWALFNPPGYWLDYLKLLINAQALF